MKGRKGIIRCKIWQIRHMKRNMDNMINEATCRFVLFSSRFSNYGIHNKYHALNTRPWKTTTPGDTYTYFSLEGLQLRRESRIQIRICSLNAETIPFASPFRGPQPDYWPAPGKSRSRFIPTEFLDGLLDSVFVVALSLRIGVRSPILS